MRKILSSVALAAAALGGVSTSANAYVILTLSDGINPPLVCNTLIGGCPAGFFIIGPLGSNSVSFNGNVGNFNVVTTSGTGNAPGGLFSSILNASTTQVTNNGAAGNFGIDVVGFGYTLPPGPLKTLEGKASETSSFFQTGDKIVNTFSTDPLDGGAPTIAVGCNITIIGDDSCNSGAPVVWASGGPSFSMRDTQLFTLGANSSVNSTSTVIVNRVPEPVSTSLVGIGLLALALSSRRRAAKKA